MNKYEKIAKKLQEKTILRTQMTENTIKILKEIERKERENEKTKSKKENENI